MTDISVRDLRSRGGKILDSAMRGETVTVTRRGRPIAELRPRRRGTDTGALLAQWRGTPAYSFVGLRADLSEIVEDDL